MRFSAERIFAMGYFAEGKHSSPVELSPTEMAIIDRIVRRIRRRIDLRFARTLESRARGEGRGLRHSLVFGKER
jgi:hypothetical protein